MIVKESVTKKLFWSKSAASTARAGPSSTKAMYARLRGFLSHSPRATSSRTKILSDDVSWRSVDYRSIVDSHLEIVSTVALASSSSRLNVAAHVPRVVWRSKEPFNGGTPLQLFFSEIAGF